MIAAQLGSQGGWSLLSLLVLLPPLVQGGAPRLPMLGVELGILALAISWARSWSRAPRRELRLTALDALLGLLLLWVLSSVIVAPYYHAAESAALAIGCYVALYWYLSFHPSLAGLSLALGAVRAQAAFQALLALWQAFVEGRVRPPGTFYNPNFLAGFLAAALLIVLGGLIWPNAGERRRPVRRFLAVTEAALLLGALLLTGSRGGALAFAAGLVVLLGLRSWRVAVLALAAGGGALVAIPNPLTGRLMSLHADAFAYTRLDIWKSAWSMMLDHPLLGVGLGQFEFISTRYAFPVSTHWAKYTRIAENAHSEYLQAGAELGIPGLMLALGIGGLLALAGFRRLRVLPLAARGPISVLIAGCFSIAVHALADFPLHAPPGALLLVLFAAGLRLHGADSPGRPVSFRIRPAYAAVAVVVALVLAATAVRPVVGFWYFLGGIGAPRNLLDEKRSLEMAPREALPAAESLRLLARAARIDCVNASYHRALGSRLFQAALRGETGDDALRSALYHLVYAAELNPNQFQYAVNSGQAMVALARRVPPGRERLKEALAHFRRAAALAPTRHMIYTEIGALCDELGDSAEAEVAFRRAVALEEYYLRGWYNLGAFYARHGRFTEARETFSRGGRLAEQAASLVPTSEDERELIALKPESFYNELRKIEVIEHLGEAAS